MPFVKLDCGILDSTIWIDREAREVFITALLMATPVEFTESQPQIAVDSLELTGWTVPAGWYGFVPACGSGIVRRSGVELQAGMEALGRLCAPETESRSSEFEGRRMARIDGGYVVLNFIKYRERDNTSSERSRRWREKQRRVATVQRPVATANDTKQSTEYRVQKQSTEAEGERESARNGVSQDVAQGKDTEPVAFYAEAPSWEEWWTYCQQIGYGAEWHARRKWNQASESNWTRHPNWRAHAATCKGYWEQDGGPAQPPGKDGASKAYWEAKSRYDLVCSELKAIEDRSPTDAMHNMMLSEPDKAAYAKLREQRRQLRKQLGIS